ncbi:MAG: ankyrin repeat domain-containing protein, partial [Burkholderia gladioli]
VKLLLPVVNLGAKKSAGAALSICAQLGWAEGVRLLLDAIEGAAGGNPSTVRSFAKRGGGIGRTTLILAAGSACAECVELLLPLFEADAVDSDGKTALMVAAEAQKGAPAGCVAKLAAASNVLKRDWRGRNALHHAARCGLPEAVEILAPLIDPRLRDKECENALDATRARLDDDGERIRETLRRAIAERERGEIEAAAKEAGPPAGVALRARSL